VKPLASETDDPAADAGARALAQAVLSVVVPLYNEEQVLPELLRRLQQSVLTLPVREVEILLVSDGSVDGTNAIVRRVVAGDNRFQGILFARNFGHQAAVSIGIERSRGDYVAIIDGDLQDPPEEIGRLLEIVGREADVAYGVRRRRKEHWAKRMAYASFYRILGRIADIEIPLDAGDFCCMRRCVVDAMLQLPERNRFVRGLRAWVGFRQRAVPYARESRSAGQPKYTLRKLLRLARDGFFGFSTVPVAMMQVLGFVVSMMACLIAAGYFVWFFLDRDSFPSGFATVTVSIWLLGGIQLLFLGLIGEYLVRTFDESRARPVAIVAEHLRHPQVS